MSMDRIAYGLWTLMQLLAAVVSAYRYDGYEFDTQMADSEAGILREEIQEKAFNHEEFIRILCTRSKAQLKRQLSTATEIFMAHPLPRYGK